MTMHRLEEPVLHVDIPGINLCMLLAYRKSTLP